MKRKRFGFKRLKRWRLIVYERGRFRGDSYEFSLTMSELEGWNFGVIF